MFCDCNHNVERYLTGQWELKGGHNKYCGFGEPIPCEINMGNKHMVQHMQSS